MLIPVTIPEQRYVTNWKEPDLYPNLPLAVNQKMCIVLFAKWALHCVNGETLHPGGRWLLSIQKSIKNVIFFQILFIWRHELNKTTFYFSRIAQNEILYFNFRWSQTVLKRWEVSWECWNGGQVHRSWMWRHSKSSPNCSPMSQTRMTQHQTQVQRMFNPH